MYSARQMLTSEDILEKIRACDVDAVVAAMKQYPKIKSKGYFDGRSVIEMVMILGCLPLLKILLLGEGIKPTKDILDIRGRNYYYLPLSTSPCITLFVWSLDLQKKDISQFLLDQYILPLEPNLRRKVLAECLRTVSTDNSLEYIDWLVERGADVNDPKYGTPLIAAASTGDNKAIQALIAHGSEINQKVKGADALWTAVFNRQYDTARLLMQNGAKPENARVKQLKEYPEMFPSGNSLDLALAYKDHRMLDILQASYNL